MVRVPIDDSLFEGAVSVEHGDGWVRPWRLPCDRLDLFPAPGDSLVARARESSGARLRFETEAVDVKLSFLPIETPPVNANHTLDITIEGKLIATCAVPEGGDAVLFEHLPGGSKVVELWLPHDSPIEITGLEVTDGCACRAVPDPRPKWVTYGSSLTHCRRAHSPARTWPAVVARSRGWNLTSLGYGGNCCLEPMVGAMIRDLPADFVTLKLGINCIGGALSPRTFAAAVMGLVRTIREKKPDLPLALISPIGYPPHETTPNVLNYTIEGMRRDIEDVHRRLVARGDRNLYYFNGLVLFNLDEIAQYTEDQCHPNGDGIELMGRHFLDRVLPNIPLGFCP